MLGTKGGVRQSPQATKVAPQTPTTPKSVTKKVQSVAGEFVKSVCNWLEVDDTGQELVQSISGLRERIWQISKELASMKQRTTKQAEWKKHGYRNRNDELLSIEDLELALHHDVLQHERMLTSLRKMLSGTAQTQEAMGRRLDEFYRLLDDAQMVRGSFLSLEDCQGLYTATANELYRKQMLAEKVLDSVSDRLLYREDEHGSNDENPRRLAQQCSEQWSRRHKDCCLLEVAEILEKIEQNAR